ncbi:MAG: hypothetical protein J3Q66DRAFT_409141 [Benniella sp.]|nr:MAG: hypothetical protein J3Q66DRAFT_409141 [Benniella sp.]
MYQCAATRSGSRRPKCIHDYRPAHGVLGRRYPRLIAFIGYAVSYRIACCRWCRSGRGEPGTPLDWVDISAALTIMQKSNYRKILEFKDKIHSPLHAGRSCSECTSPITWREVQLRRNKALKGHDRSSSQTAELLSDGHEPEPRFMGKFRKWVSHRLESFESRAAALNTIMTVAIQGYCCGQGEYTAREMLYLTDMAKAASPTCFWSGEGLVITSSTDLVTPTHKFTADRVVFRDGQAPPYGADEQVLVASSEFANCVEERIRYLEDNERQWNEGTTWADKVISDIREGYDADTGSHHKNDDRVGWTKFEWRFLHEMCQGRSLVTGQLLEPKDFSIDRVFNSDRYELTNCIIIESGLNWAKKDMKEFKTSRDFTGPCKLEYGIQVLRDAVKKLIEGSRPRQQRYTRGLPVPHATECPSTDRHQFIVYQSGWIMYSTV